MNNDIFTFTLTVFTGFFAIMNPVANTPIFLGLTEGLSKTQKEKVARKSVTIALLIEFIFLLLGKYIFELFGINIPAFKITGGILLFFIGVDMLNSQKSKMHSTNKDVDIDSIAVSPLAIPILAGPGTIVTGMNFAQNTSYLQLGIVTAVFLFVIILTYYFFKMSNKIVDFLGENLIAVIGKLMGLIIAIIGTDMVINGIKIAFNLK
jgi:multiple antibiotic resistance protein